MLKRQTPVPAATSQYHDAPPTLPAPSRTVQQKKAEMEKREGVLFFWLDCQPLYILFPWLVCSMPVCACCAPMSLGEAAMFPAAVELYSRWVPVTERTRAMARLLSGIPLGTLVGLIATGWIVGRYAWQMAFYSFGVLGLLWVAVWFWWVANDPATDVRISPAERTLLAPLQMSSAKSAPTPWKKLLTHGPLWAMVTAYNRCCVVRRWVS